MTNPADIARALSEYEHYSREPLLSVQSKSQIDEPDRKPRGLWISVPGNDDWPSWCRDEGFRLGALSNCATITLHECAKVLHIRSARELDDFHEAYSVWAREAWKCDLISWAGVAQDYQGVVIAPYQWSHRLYGPVSRWYYGWDCASGCIWDADAIASISTCPTASDASTDRNQAKVVRCGKGIE